jgi:hypothetical protein
MIRNPDETAEERHARIMRQCTESLMLSSEVIAQSREAIARSRERLRATEAAVKHPPGLDRST